MFDMPKTTEKSVDVEAVLFTHVPALQRYPFALRRLFIWVLKALVNEDRINQFLQNNDYLKEFDFIDRVFEELEDRLSGSTRRNQKYSGYWKSSNCCQSSAWRVGWVGLTSASSVHYGVMCLLL